MSVSIFWKPVVPDEGQNLHIPAPSAFQAAMRDAGMELPCTLTRDLIPLLRGMAAVFGPHAENRPNPYQQIIDLLDKHEAVELWAVY